jgi:hypothetical protein
MSVGGVLRKRLYVGMAVGTSVGVDGGTGVASGKGNAVLVEESTQTVGGIGEGVPNTIGKEAKCAI